MYEELAGHSRARSLRRRCVGLSVVQVKVSLSNTLLTLAVVLTVWRLKAGCFKDLVSTGLKSSMQTSYCALQAVMSLYSNSVVGFRVSLGGARLRLRFPGALARGTPGGDASAARIGEASHAHTNETGLSFRTTPSGRQVLAEPRCPGPPRRFVTVAQHGLQSGGAMRAGAMPALS